MMMTNGERIYDTIKAALHRTDICGDDVNALLEQLTTDLAKESVSDTDSLVSPSELVGDLRFL
jgi:hypothetical protein